MTQFETEPLLTPREMDVLHLLCGGITHDREIAEQLVVSQWTVHFHVARLRAKLGVHSRLQVVAFALIHRLVDQDALRRSRDAYQQAYD